jgi:predicted transcriptional regulator
MAAGFMKAMVIKIGADMDADDRALFAGQKAARRASNTLYLNSFEELRELLSPARLSLLQFLLKYPEQKQNVSQIARQTKRKQEAISRDLASLDRYGFIHKKRFVHTIQPLPAVEKIVIELKTRSPKHARK